MPKLTQLTVSCEDRPSSLARIARLLGDANINILALLATAAVDGGFIGLVVAKPKKAKKALDAAHMHYTEQPVLHVEFPNTPGALASLADKLAAKAINITAVYETSVHDAKKASVVLAVSDFEKAARIR